MSTDERSVLIALNAARGLPRGSLCRLGRDLSTWLPRGSEPSRDLEEVARLSGLPPQHLARARALVPEAEARAATVEEAAARLGARLITRRDDGYPPALLDLELPPPVLYVLGEIPTGPAVAIVGSRKATPYGLEAATLFAGAAARSGVTVVSGFARGIDTAAHRAAIAEAGGKTVAVLGCGLDVLYPSTHGDLRRGVAANGALISELPLGFPPRPWSFPIRNRIIAALTGATLVVQATVRSGSLISAHHALELGRDVYAVPGSIFDKGSHGPHGLIRDGAILVNDPEHLLASLGPPRRLPLELAVPAAPPPRPLPGGAQGKLLKHLPQGQEHGPDDLALATGLPVNQILSTLLDLELGGWIRRLPGPVYRRTLY